MDYFARVFFVTKSFYLHSHVEKKKKRERAKNEMTETKEKGKENSREK
jgi:hypothetical protein